MGDSSLESQVELTEKQLNMCSDESDDLVITGCIPANKRLKIDVKTEVKNEILETKLFNQRIQYVIIDLKKTIEALNRENINFDRSSIHDRKRLDDLYAEKKLIYDVALANNEKILEKFKVQKPKYEECLKNIQT